jgi:hypothetical protein
MFSMLINLTKASVGVALLPATILSDIVTLPSTAESGKHPFSISKKMIKLIEATTADALKIK